MLKARFHNPVRFGTINKEDREKGAPYSSGVGSIPD